MILYNSKNSNERVSFSEAVIKGIPNGGGLYMPVSLPVMSTSFFKECKHESFPEISYKVASALLGKEIDSYSLRSIIDNAFNFEIPLIHINDNIYTLELFHGPTSAFKDIGARFMAGILSYLTNLKQEKRVVLVATSGDTGSAVANAFMGIPNTTVVLLYPSGKISNIQELQLTTLGANITALEVKGTFDDCQKLVKEAFSDSYLNKKINLTSANSINIARLIPQSFYYHYAYSRFISDKNSNLKDSKIIFSVPSGNLGNLTGGLIAKKMGLPVTKFIAAVNSNRVIPDYLETGLFTPISSIQTVSNAMDVGNPSNFERLLELLDNSHSKAIKCLYSRSYNNSETIENIKRVNSAYSYLLDPHSSVGYLAIEDFKRKHPGQNSFILLETAHPAKFPSVIEQALVELPKIPDGIKQCLTKQKHSILISNDIKEFKDLLYSID